MFKKLLVANRGEIAVRIIRSAQELGLKAVAVYEETDKESYHIMRADEAFCLGSGPRKDYLSIERIVEAAQKTGAQAVHPGYGFLAENPAFSEACTDAGLVFVGPPPKVISDMGSKVVARRIMVDAGIPMIPGTGVLSRDEEGEREAREFLAEHGLPIMVKAVSGGGGRGIRMVEEADKLAEVMRASRSEAVMAFGNDEIYLEKCLKNSRHVEVQILADKHGNIVHLGSRNCSIQRRHQKLVEIAPSLLDNGLEQEMCRVALDAARAASYESAGTVEFLVDPEDNFYFLEMNTRIQVEHTVTEMITGIDIVREQISIAAGENLSITQEHVNRRGYAIELRINAEDPKNDFIATPGTINVYIAPGGHGVRLDGAVYEGYDVPQFYDSMLVKLTVYGFTWEEAVQRLTRALDGFVIIGPYTTIPFFQQLVKEKDFLAKRFDTSYLETHRELFDYRVKEREEDKLARLISEINARGFNPHAE